MVKWQRQKYKQSYNCKVIKFDAWARTGTKKCDAKTGEF